MCCRLAIAHNIAAGVMLVVQPVDDTIAHLTRLTTLRK